MPTSRKLTRTAIFISYRQSSKISKTSSRKIRRKKSATFINRLKQRHMTQVRICGPSATQLRKRYVASLPRLFRSSVANRRLHIRRLAGEQTPARKPTNKLSLEIINYSHRRHDASRFCARKSALAGLRPRYATLTRRAAVAAGQA